MDPPLHEQPQQMNSADFFEKAKGMLVLTPPDVVLFSELVWGTVVVCVKTYFLDRYGTIINTHSGIKKSMKLVLSCFQSDSFTGGRLSKAFTYALFCHTNFHMLGFLNEGLRQSILDSIEDVEENIRKADEKMVQDAIQKKEFVSWREQEEGTMSYAKKEFTYNKQAW